jgi:SAM-dependent methyltransferase
MTEDQNAGPTEPLDLARVLADIEQEVRTKRASGELNSEFERHLDTAFAKLAPVAAVSGDFHALLAKLEESTTFDTRAPTTSANRGIAQVKAIVGRAIDWDLRHLASQVSGVAYALTRALGLLGERVDDLERESPAAGERILTSLGEAYVRGGLPEGDWAPSVAEALGRPAGRVLHTECGGGSLVQALRDRGLDVYGVDPDPRVVQEASTQVVDLRVDGPRDHLRALPEGSLAAVVLTGIVDRITGAGSLELARLARTALMPGGRLVVVSHQPDAWIKAHPVLADLVGGRPLHEETWVVLLQAGGFIDVTGFGGSPAGFAVTALR